MSTAKLGNPIVRAALGIAGLVAIVFLANWLMTLSAVGKAKLDLTEDKVHTLSDGTKAILGDLDAPVVIRYYATQKAEAMSRDLELYMRKVDDLLKQYAALADGRIRIERLDPQPDTDAEDSANIDGMQGQRIVDGTYEENIFHGVAISCLDQREVIPFLNPRDEPRLEYDLSRAIAQVSQPVKPVVGVMSAHNLAGGPPTMPGQPGMPPWAVYQQLNQTYEVRNLGMQPGELDPEEITVLFLLHPAGLTPAAEFQIDQYVLKGGTVIACLDAYSFLAAEMSRGNPMAGGGVPTSSTLPNLLEAWGVSFTTSEVLADRTFATELQDGRVAPALLALTPEAFAQQDDLALEGLNDLWLIFSGSFSVSGGKGVASGVILEASENAALVDAFRASQIDQSLLTSVSPDGKQHAIALRLSGTFPTAFPDGDPAVEEEEEEEEPAAETETADTVPAPADGDAPAEDLAAGEDSPAADAGADAGDTGNPAEAGTLKKGVKPGSVVLIGDSDFLFDQFAYVPNQVGNMRFYSPRNSNPALLFNLLDQAVGSKHLIGSRSRASSRRPFTLVQEMEAEFEQRVGEKIEELEEKRAEIQQKVDALQDQKAAGTEMILSPEQLQEQRNWQAQIANFNKAIREEQKALKREKDKLASTVTLLNVLVIPLLVLIIAIIVQVRRRSLREAR